MTLALPLQNNKTKIYLYRKKPSALQVRVHFSNLHLNAVILRLKNEKLSSERALICAYANECKTYTRVIAQLQFTLLANKTRMQPVPFMRLVYIAFQLHSFHRRNDVQVDVY